MSNDLLFSVLPREGKVAMTRDEFKVQQVSKEASLRELSDEEQELKAEERESRQQQQEGNKKQSAQSEQQTQDSDEQESEQGKKPKGPRHLDIFV